ARLPDDGPVAAVHAGLLDVRRLHADDARRAHDADGRGRRGRGRRRQHSSVDRGALGAGPPAEHRRAGQPAARAQPRPGHPGHSGLDAGTSRAHATERAGLLMQGFQDLSGWVGRDPYAAGANGRPSIAALRKLQGLQGVSPTDVPYSPDEMDLAFGQQADEAQGAMSDWLASGGTGMSPALARARGNAIGGGHWADFSDALDRSQIMAGNRGFNSRVDLVGRGPGTGTGIGRWYAQQGHGNGFGSFTPDTTSINLEDLLSDANE